jgi:hypothetical protein
LVVITHPIHPFAGRALRLLKAVRHFGRPAFIVEYPDGLNAVIPVDWTDRRPPAQAETNAKLQPEALIELCALMNELGTKHLSAGGKIDKAENAIRVATDLEQPRIDLRSAERDNSARATGRTGQRAASKRGRARTKSRGKEQ